MGTGTFRIHCRDRCREPGAAAEGARDRPARRNSTRGQTQRRREPDRSGRRRAVRRIPFEARTRSAATSLKCSQAGVQEASKNFAGLVVGNDAEHFSAGANLMLILLEAQEGNWDDIDAMVRGFQRATMALKYSPVPVVVAPAGLALGGGCEICPARRPRSCRGGNLHGPGRSRRRSVACRRRHQGNAVAACARRRRKPSRRLDSPRSQRARPTPGDSATSVMKTTSR